MIEVQVGEQYAAERLSVLGKPLSQGGSDRHFLAMHEGRHDAAQGGVLRIVAQCALDTGVDDEHAARRMPNDVKVDLDRLVAVDEARGLRLRMIEVDETAAVDGPIGRVDGLDLDGSRLVDDRREVGRAAARPERARLRRVRRIRAGAEGRCNKSQTDSSQRFHGVPGMPETDNAATLATAVPTWS